MHSASHRLNHDFQLTHFLANACKTPDGAYALLYGQKIDMEHKLKKAQAQQLRSAAHLLKIMEKIEQAKTEIENLEANAELLEFQASKYTTDMNFAGAQAELAHIERLMAELEPQRKYAHLSILEANEACQQEEWGLELQWRGENYQIANLTGIPADQIDTMRAHPDFETKILPHIVEFRSALNTARGDLSAVLSKRPKTTFLSLSSPAAEQFYA